MIYGNPLNYSWNFSVDLNCNKIKSYFPQSKTKKQERIPFFQILMAWVLNCMSNFGSAGGKYSLTVTDMAETYFPLIVSTV